MLVLFQGVERLGGGNPRLRDHIPGLLVLQRAALCAADSASHVDLPHSAHRLPESADRLGEPHRFVSVFCTLPGARSMTVCEPPMSRIVTRSLFVLGTASFPEEWLFN